jgi:ABC-type nitrate/sulfonate/bicarbonate transport system substrate-binding protein
VLAFPIEGFLYVPIHAAQKLGYFADEDLNVEVIVFQKGGSTVLGRDADAYVGFPATAIRARTKCQAVRAFAAVQTQFGSTVVIQGDAARKAGGFVMVDLAKSEYEPLANFLFTAIISRDDWLAKNHGTAEKLVRALWRGEQMLRTDPAIFDTAWAASLPSYPATPRIEAAGVEKNMAFMKAAEAEPVRITADQVSTNAIVEAVAPTMPDK